MCVCIQGDISASTSDTFAFGLPQLPASDVVNTISKWDGMDDTLAVFDERLKAEKSEVIHICRVQL